MVRFGTLTISQKKTQAPRHNKKESGYLKTREFSKKIQAPTHNKKRDQVS